MDDSSPGVIPKSLLFTITLKLKCSIRRGWAHLLPYIYFHSLTQYKGVHEMNWFWEGGFQHTLRFEGEQKNETKNRNAWRIDHRHLRHLECYQLLRIPWRYLTKRGVWWQKRTKFTWLINYFIHLQKFTEYAGSYLVLGIQQEVKRGMVCDSQNLQLTQHY